MKNSFKILLLALLSSSLLTSCSVEDGEDGLQGIQGIQGETGASGMDGEDGADGIDGIDGEDGQDGVDGNFIAFASEWIPILDAESINAYSGEVTQSFRSDLNFEAPEIDQHTLDTSVILIYAQVNDIDQLAFGPPAPEESPEPELITQVTNLPFDYNMSAGPGSDIGINIDWSFSLSENNMKLHYMMSFINRTEMEDMGMLPSEEDYPLESEELKEFMFEFFPQPVQSFRYVIIPTSETSKKQPLNLQKMAYHEVMEYYGLE